MGQPIELAEPVVLDDVAVFDSDRSITGQDGETFDRTGTTRTDFPAELAGRILDADGDADHVFVYSNTISVRRRGGWNDAALAATGELIADFFVFYEENKSS